MAIGRLPQPIDLLLYAGDSTEFGFSDDDEPIDPAVGQWAAQVKVEGSSAIVAEFTVTPDETTPGRVVISMAPDATQRLGDLGQRFRWDLQQTFDDSTVRTRAAGEVIVEPDVTRSLGEGADTGTHGASRLTEDGGHWLNEDGGYRLLEAS